jgi:hypothetical protein
VDFADLHRDINCNCLEGAVIDNCSLFVRRVNLKSPFKIGDFKISPAKKPLIEDCENWCGIRGLSTHIFNSDSVEHIIDKNIITLGIATLSKKQLSVFRIKIDGGMVKHTPNQEHGFDPYHFDYYKPDDFDISNHLELVELLTIEDLQSMKNV